MGRAGSASLMVALSLVLGGCDSAGYAGPAVAPTRTPGTALAPPALLQPPATAAPAQDTSPSARALLAAVAKTAEAGSLRTRISATVTGDQPGKIVQLDAISEAESGTRYHFNLTINSVGRVSTTEAIAYDGRYWNRSGGDDWKPSTQPNQSYGPQSYLNFLGGATAVIDAGAGDRNGAASEKYTATVKVPSGSTTTAAQLTAWVDRAAGRLIGEDISIGDPLTSSTALLHIDFYDFGATIKVVPPI